MLMCRRSSSSHALHAPLCRRAPVMPLAATAAQRWSSRCLSTSAAGVRTNALRFDLSPKEIGEATSETIAAYKKMQARMVNVPSRDRSFQNTIQALADYDAYSAGVAESCVFPSYVSSDADVREAAGSAEKALSDFAIESSMREDIFDAFMEYYNHAMPQEHLSPVQRRLVEKAMRDFKKNGLMLPPDKREQLKSIRKKLSDNSISFQKNLNEDKTVLQFTFEELDGLPQDFINGLEKVESQEGPQKYKVTLRYPDLVPVMQYARNENTRKRLDLTNAAKCMSQNVPLLEETLSLRQEAAELLGFRDHASFVLEDRMAKNPTTVLQFITDLSDKVEPLARKEWEKMLSLKKSTSNGSSSATIESHDFAFYNQRILETDYQVDNNLIKDYFPFETVTEGMLSVYQDLLDLRFQEVQDAHIWHRDVRMFGVYDRTTNSFMGHFYLDLWPREGKYPHAAVFPLIPSHHFSSSSADIPEPFYAALYPVDGEDGQRAKRQAPVVAMVANFTKPQSDRPSLLKHAEVETYFHEFGHVMHGICTKARYSRFSGTSVERDFVEAPSQMLENWCYEKDVLKRLSSHYRTKEPLPDHLLEKLIKAKHANTGLLNRRQIFFAMFDMLLHTNQHNYPVPRHPDTGRADTGKLWAQLRKELNWIEQPAGTNPAASFGHIMGGYDAQYYGYKYAEVFSADMFSLFKDGGAMNRSIGRRYRDLILAPGGEKDSLESLVAFLGRAPTNDAFLRHIGLTEHA